LGSLAFYISHARAISYQPTNISFGIIPELQPNIRKRLERREALVKRALLDLDSWIRDNGDGLGLETENRREAG